MKLTSFIHPRAAYRIKVRLVYGYDMSTTCQIKFGLAQCYFTICYGRYDWRPMEIYLRGFRHKPVTLSCENLCEQNRNQYCLNQTLTVFSSQCLLDLSMERNIVPK